MNRVRVGWALGMTGAIGMAVLFLVANPGIADEDLFAAFLSAVLGVVLVANSMDLVPLTQHDSKPRVLGQTAIAIVMLLDAAWLGVRQTGSEWWLTVAAAWICGAHLQ